VISHSKKVECTCDSPVIWVKGIAFRSIKTDPTDVSPSDMQIDGDRVAKCSLEELNFAVEGGEKISRRRRRARVESNIKRQCLCFAYKPDQRQQEMD